MNTPVQNLIFSIAFAVILSLATSAMELDSKDPEYQERATNNLLNKELSVGWFN
jgi:hypothetical protein